MTMTRKKLIEVALPLEAINKACIREASMRHGNPNTLHLWWARRRLAAARATIFSQMVDDPSANSDLFPTERAQQKERARLFKIVEDLIQWENTTNEEVLNRAREEIWQSWRRTCAQNADHPRATELFNRHVLPAFHDPFAGGGALPLEAQRLGLVSYASDLNPVAVLINKAMIEIPPRFTGKPPVNPEARKNPTLAVGGWRGGHGLAEDVRYYGTWVRDEAAKRIGHLYPKIEVTGAMVKERFDLKPYEGRKLTVIAWIWVRTVKSPNPAFAKVDVPLASSFLLATKAAKEAYVEPVIEGGGYRFTVKVGKPGNLESVRAGTKLARGANFRCLMSNSVIDEEYIKKESMAGRVGVRLMAIVAEGNRRRVYLEPTGAHEELARQGKPQSAPDQEMNRQTSNLVSGRGYGFFKWADLFTDRQLVSLTTLSELIGEAMSHVRRDAVASGVDNDSRSFRDGGVGAMAYSEAVGVYLGTGLSRIANYGSAFCTWHSGAKYETVTSTFGRQALPMTWDFAEGNIFSSSSGNWLSGIDWITRVIVNLPANPAGYAYQADAASNASSAGKVVSTDPPYYDNICYSDLSDFFYVWLRPSLRAMFPDLFATVAVPKTEELVVAPYRHASRLQAEKFFLDGMTRVMRRLAEDTHPAFPVTIYYAFRQSETESDTGTASTGWETFLDAVTRAGFGISGTWPMRTEYTGNLKKNVSALASSIVLVCRPKHVDAPSATRREFVASLKAELPIALAHLQRANIAPVDLAQAAIGPGMALYTRYTQVLDAEGNPLSVRQALALINETLDEALSEQEGDFDADTRWALAWCEQYGFSEGEFGVADVLARAKNTSVQGLVNAGILKSSRGDVRLLKPSELATDWDPSTDTRLSAWESVHQLIRALESGGESAAAELVAKLGSKAELARELCYRLYTLCERKKRAAEALSYNALVQSFPELERLAKEPGRKAPAQASMLVDGEE